MTSFLKILKPSIEEIEDIALRETDPDHWAEFEPFTRGPVFALWILCKVAMYSAFLIPLRVLRLVVRRFL